MNKELLLGIGVGSLIALCIVAKRSSAASSLTPFSPLAKGSKILLVGDSLAVGLQTRLGVNAKDNGYPFAADAVGGTKADQWAQRIGGVLARERPQLVLVSLGTNDALNAPVEKEAPDVASLVRQIRDAGAVPIWIFPITMPSNFTNGLTTFRSLVRAQGVETLDSSVVLIPRPAADPIHPGGAGYATWADWIWGTLQSRNIVY